MTGLIFDKEVKLRYRSKLEVLKRIDQKDLVEMATFMIISIYNV